MYLFIAFNFSPNTFISLASNMNKMKNLLISVILLAMSVTAFSSELFILNTGSVERTKAAFNQNTFVIHFYNDDFIIGSSDDGSPAGSLIIDNNAWMTDDVHYFILYYPAENRDQYTALVAAYAKILYDSGNFLAVSTSGENTKQLIPAIHGGIVRIENKAARFPDQSFSYHPGSLQMRDYIADLIDLVDMDTLEAFVQRLQDFGTRNAYKAGGIQAQNWILAKLQSYGLETELHDFWMPGGNASDNVIATLPGNVYPDEYVIIGAHYDSYAGGSNEPGADDNATGTAGVLEAARILSQYQFDRTIIFAAWSGEEYGLYGSDAWATEAANEEMNILGYFNIDMAGYLQEGDAIHTDIIAPASANELRQFYKDICAIYLPDFQTSNGMLTGGDSDHTSFNNNGYPGIFPFEDSQNYSPYIHTSNDLIGPSVNNFEQHMTFVKAAIANVVSLSDLLPRPEDLTALSGDQQVELAWDPVAEAASYNIYRDGGEEPYATTEETSFTDTGVENMVSYTYYVTAVFEGSGEESGPSNSVTVMPMPPIVLPFFDDFETGGLFWSREGTWGLQQGIYYSSSNSLTESPDEKYEANLEISSTLRPIDLTGAFSAELSFWTKYEIESGWDFMNLEISVAGLDWEQLANYSGLMEDWTQLTYSLDDYIGQSDVIVRFRFKSDGFVQEQGMYIDDLEISINGIGIYEKTSDQPIDFRINPNPATDLLRIDYTLESAGSVEILIADLKGTTVSVLDNSYREKGDHFIHTSLEPLPAGSYMVILRHSGKQSSRKLIITE